MVIPEIKPKHASIEVCTACNHTCLYCPVSEHPQRQRVMPLELFSHVIDELEKLEGPLKRISFNHYNETLLDPHLIERVRIATAQDFFGYVLIFTNLGYLPDSYVEDLQFARDRLLFNVNLPTVDRVRYRLLHGVDQYQAVDNNLWRLHEAGYPLRINIQQNQLITQEDTDGVVERYGNKVRINLIQSVSRSGLVKDFPHPSVEGRLAGCDINRATDYVHIGIDGEVFFCCMDYFKRFQMGNVTRKPLNEILASDLSREYLGHLYGESDPPQDFICRTCEHVLK